MHTFLIFVSGAIYSIVAILLVSYLDEAGVKFIGKIEDFLDNYNRPGTSDAVQFIVNMIGGLIYCVVAPVALIVHIAKRGKNNVN